MSDYTPLTIAGPSRLQKLKSLIGELDPAPSVKVLWGPKIYRSSHFPDIIFPTQPILLLPDRMNARQAMLYWMLLAVLPFIPGCRGVQIHSQVV